MRQRDVPPVRARGGYEVIVTQLKGGIGNQLFQYAAGRRLALSRGADLFLDISSLAKSVRMVRSYELHPFNIVARIADDEVLSRIPPARQQGLWKRIAEALRGHTSSSFLREFKEKHFHFDPDMLTLHDDVYLAGYWQSERYFTDVADLIRCECTVTTLPEGKNLDMHDEIAACEAVSVHVRRGDYVTDPEVLAMHGTCSVDYYEKAASYITERVKHPVFFIFSDEPQWVRDNIKLNHPVNIVTHNGPDRGYEDMRLMSLCRHHIIANSSFSWWGAWLNPKQDKIVIAPKRWFNDHDADTRDICPDSWVRL